MGTTSTKLQDHSQRSHALLSASGASRWLNCTPSARLEEEFGQRRTSAYAEEGTLAHELSELYLSRDVLQSIDEDTFNSRLEEIMANDLFNEEMLDVIPIYTDYCAMQYAEAKTNCGLASIEIEQKFDLTEYVPESFGTSDCTIIADDVLEVIDLKYGKGVPVYATWNKQLMLYGLGALRMYDTMYCISKLRLTIVQPRINNISTFEISVEELISWAEQELKSKALDAFEGRGTLEAGDWCKFCSVKNKCRALYEKNMEIAKYEQKKAEFLTDEEISDVIKRTPALIEWANSILTYANEKAIGEGKHWPGFKLVEGTSRRKWIDEDSATQAILDKLPELSEDDIFNMKLKPITQIEKTVGKKRFNEILSDVVVKPQGKPILVPEEDKCPALGVSQAQLDFKE
jgi:hypothetical protein